MLYVAIALNDEKKILELDNRRSAREPADQVEAFGCTIRVNRAYPSMIYVRTDCFIFGASEKLRKFPLHIPRCSKHGTEEIRVAVFRSREEAEASDLGASGFWVQDAQPYTHIGVSFNPTLLPH